MSNALSGIITCSDSGNYIVKTDNGDYLCRARGAFRYKGISPCVGDLAEIDAIDAEKGQIISIGERKNLLIRPPLANIDRIVIVTSLVDPAPNFFITDKLTVISEYKDIKPVIVITKTDLCEDDGGFSEVYRKAGFDVFEVSNLSGEGTDKVKNELSEGISALIGNTGTGKSSLLNNLSPLLALKTGETSKKLGRGRHTTRKVELFRFGNGYIADTPGFSTVNIGMYDVILKDKLQFCFKDFEKYINKCEFTGCSHTNEKGCAVLAAVENGEIARSRHNSYVELYNEAKNIKEWEINKTDRNL